MNSLFGQFTFQEVFEVGQLTVFVILFAFRMFRMSSKNSLNGQCVFVVAVNWRMLSVLKFYRWILFCDHGIKINMLTSLDILIILVVSPLGIK